MGLNSKLKANLNDVSKEDAFYEKLISMGDAGDFGSGKYNSLTNFVNKKKNIIVQVGYDQLLKMLK